MNVQGSLMEANFNHKEATQLTAAIGAGQQKLKGRQGRRAQRLGRPVLGM